jgi:hypothetical protein
MTTDLEDFLVALHEPAPETGPVVPLDEIVRKGRRLRTRRRLAGGMAWITALSVVVGGCFLLFGKPSSTSLPPADLRPSDTFGAPIRTGIVQPGGEIVVMMAYNDVSGMQSVGCFAADDGALSGCRTVWDWPRREYATGFHAVHAPVTVEGRGDLPIFGFFIGPAATITVNANGRTVAAQTAVWSEPAVWAEDADIELFWFPRDEVSPAATLTGWAAYDADGKSLPTGQVLLEAPHA